MFSVRLRAVCASTRAPRLLAGLLVATSAIAIGGAPLSARTARATTAANPAAGATDSGGPWTLNWQDDFAGTTLTKGAWQVYNTPNTYAAKLASNVVVHDGMVTMKTVFNPTLQKWTSSGMCACTKPQTYGKYEMRVRSSAGDSRVVALLWPDNHTWPPEIDIMEMGGKGAQGTRQMSTQTLHYGANNSMIHSSYTADMTQWHVVGAEWAPGVVRYTLDGMVTQTIVSPYVSSTPMWFGLQTAPEKSALPTVPVDMDVDWVRAYSYIGGPAIVPDSPTAVSATSGDTSATLSWSPPASDGNSPLSSYTVTTYPGGATTTVPGVNGAPPPTSVTVRGLAVGTSYTFTVRATNPFGTSGESPASNAVVPTGTPPTISVAPRPAAVVPGVLNTAGTTPVITTATKWAATAGSSDICSYELQRSIDDGPSAPVTLPRRLATQATDTLPIGTRLRYQVRAIGCNGLASPWVSGGSTRYALTDDTDGGLTYTGPWTETAQAGASGGQVASTTGRNAAVTATVTGASTVALVATVGPGRSSVKVCVDGIAAGWINTAATTTSYRRVLGRITLPATGTHTVSVVNLATSGRPRLDFDGLLLTGS